MGFLPRRRGQSFGGFGRRTRTVMRGPKKHITTSYAETGGVNTIGPGTSIDFAVLSASDSPTKTTITNLATAGTSAVVENNSVILKKGSFFKLNLFAALSFTVIGIWIYRNKGGYITAPTNSFDFNQGPLTEDNAQLREATVYYTRIALTAEESRTLRIPLWSKRNRSMTDSTVLRMVIHNQNLTALANVNYSGYGRIRTIEG